jgi:hypothetical protein
LVLTQHQHEADHNPGGVGVVDAAVLDRSCQRRHACLHTTPALLHYNKFKIVVAVTERIDTSNAAKPELPQQQQRQRNREKKKEKRMENVYEYEKKIEQH